jgi:intracellular septation protein
MKILLDLVPFIAFLGTWSQFGIYTATAVLIVTLWVAVVLDYCFVSKKRNNMMLGTAAIATVFGVLTLVLRNALFIHIKPTVIFSLQGLVFLGSHFIGDKVILQRLMGAQIPMPDAQWRRLSLAWVAYSFLMAAINLYTALFCSEEVWAWTLGAIKISFIPFLIAHYPFIAPYLQDAAAKDAAERKG